MNFMVSETLVESRGKTEVGVGLSGSLFGSDCQGYNRCHLFRLRMGPVRQCLAAHARALIRTISPECVFSSSSPRVAFLLTPGGFNLLALCAVPGAVGGVMTGILIVQSSAWNT